MVDFTTLVNVVGISLEIVGFVFMLRAVKEMKSLMQIRFGMLERPSMIEKPTMIGNPRLHSSGIWLIIAGLGLQIIALFFV
jgi:hypothetical protein